MCKIIASTSIRSGIRTFLDKSWNNMKTTEKHGYGGAWDSNDGIGYIKSSNPRPYMPPSFCEGFYEESNLTPNGGAVIGHGRTATCGVSVENTHPFVHDNFALVHNGVVSSDKYKNEISTCDSELILQAFMAGGIHEVEKHIEGYYACFILEKTAHKTILHVIKDDMAELHTGKIKGSWVFATTMDLLRVVNAKYIAPVRDNIYLRFIGDKLVHEMDITPKQRPSMYTGGAFDYKKNRDLFGEDLESTYGVGPFVPKAERDFVDKDEEAAWELYKEQLAQKEEDNLGKTPTTGL